MSSTIDGHLSTTWLQIATGPEIVYRCVAFLGVLRRAIQTLIGRALGMPRSLENEVPERQNSI